MEDRIMNLLGKIIFGTALGIGLVFIVLDLIPYLLRSYRG